MKRAIVSLAATAALLAVLPSAHATSLAPNTTTGVTPSAWVMPSVSGSGFGFIDSKTSTVTAGSNYTATVTSAVFRENGGTLDFLYQVTNHSGSNDSLSSLVLSSFSGLTTDVFTTSGPIGGYFSAPTSSTAYAATRTNGLANDKSVTFSFSSKLDPGTTSSVLVIQTNATNYSTGSGGVTNSIETNALVFAPTPEPTSLALFATCFLGLGGASAWRRRKGMTAQA
jgi:hypothetical protein